MREIEQMVPLIEQIINSGNANHILSGRQIARLLGGSDARRYGQVNRALKTGDLVRVRRGLYLLSDRYREFPAHPFVVAQQIMPGSYISAESALSFHGWIPEAVFTVMSVVSGGKSLVCDSETLGYFEFRRLGVNPGYFLQGVSRIELQRQIALVAQPVRALMDLIALHKQKWQGLGYLLDGLRINEEKLVSVKTDEILMLRDIYKGKRERTFIKELSKALTND